MARNDVRETGGIRQIISVWASQDDGDQLFRKECIRYDRSEETRKRESKELEREREKVHE